MTATILAVGDVCGAAGMSMIQTKLRAVKKHYGVDFCVVNGENTSVSGITPKQADDMLSSGADVITLGNHAWGRREICPYLDDCEYILRPANFAPQTPGRGWREFDASFGKVRVVNLIGRCSMNFGPDSPFFAINGILKDTEPMITLVDFHAEATSEKLAMAYHLETGASALWGTHTHVQTSDAQVFQGGLGYITDLGMTGAARSVIGIEPRQSLNMFLGDPPVRFEAATGDSKMECCIFEIDTETLKCVSAEALRISG